MQYANYFKSVYFYHAILFFCFSISLNNLIEFEYVNIVFYTLFHITIVYLSFYYFHFILFFIFFLYGIFYDIFLFNNIGPHLISFIILLSIIFLLKKYLYHLSSYRVFYTLVVFILLIFIFEMVLADIFFNYAINFFKFFQIGMISVILLFPIIFLFSKIDKL